MVGRNQAGVDVRMITRVKDFPDPKHKLRNMVEALQAEGFEVGRHLKLQSRCHNKGIIVHGRIVCVGSHNRSPSGVMTNRDASLIIRHADVANCLQRIFLHDWTSRAQDVLPEQAQHAAPSPCGICRTSWDARRANRRPLRRRQPLDSLPFEEVSG